MTFIARLNSTETVQLFQEAKLKSGQKSDEEFIKQILLEHISRPVQRCSCLSRGTQVSNLDFVDDNVLDIKGKSSDEKSDQICAHEINTDINIVNNDEKNPNNDSMVEKVPFTKINQNEYVSKATNGLTKTIVNKNISCKEPAEKRPQLSSFDEESVSDDAIMFGCKECLVYFTKQEMLFSHIKHIHSIPLKDGTSYTNFVTQESTALKMKKTSCTVNPKVETGMISQEEVKQAVQSHKEEIKKERKRKKLQTKKSTKSKKAKEVLKCSECNGVFRRKRTLLDHIKLRHSDQSNLPKCNICNKTFLYESIVKRHVSLCHSNEPVKKRSKHSKGYLCETCGSTFTQKHTLKLHMNKHLNIKPYMCNHCGKTFTWLNGLEYHERTHTGERPYSCHLCTQKFKTPSDLKRHQVVHTKEKPFACSLCPKKFSQGTTLRKHFQKIHRTSSTPARTSSTPASTKKSTFDQIISLLPILGRDVQVTISDDTIEFAQPDVRNISGLRSKATTIEFAKADVNGSLHA